MKRSDSSKSNFHGLKEFFTGPDAKKHIITSVACGAIALGAVGAGAYSYMPKADGNLKPAPVVKAEQNDGGVKFNTDAQVLTNLHVEGADVEDNANAEPGKAGVWQNLDSIAPEIQETKEFKDQYQPTEKDINGKKYVRVSEVAVAPNKDTQITVPAAFNAYITGINKDTGHINETIAKVTDSGHAGQENKKTERQPDENTNITPKVSPKDVHYVVSEEKPIKYPDGTEQHIGDIKMTKQEVENNNAKNSGVVKVVKDATTVVKPDGTRQEATVKAEDSVKQAEEQKADPTYTQSGSSSSSSSSSSSDASSGDSGSGSSSSSSSDGHASAPAPDPEPAPTPAPDPEPAPTPAPDPEPAPTPAPDPEPSKPKGRYHHFSNYTGEDFTGMTFEEYCDKFSGEEYELVACAGYTSRWVYE